MHIQLQSSNKIYSLLLRLFIYFSIFSVFLFFTGLDFKYPE